jgi:hypothetical protein
MGFEYVYVDSKDRKYHENKSEILVNLTQPLHHAKSVRVVAFSAPNEFYNVIDGNTSFSARVYNVVNNQKSAIKNYVLGAGLYSLSEMITALNALFLADPIVQGSSNTTLTLTLLANGKTSLQIVGDGVNTHKRAILYYPRNGQFSNSIVHRLGFSRGQVFDDPDVGGSNLLTGDGATPPVVTVNYTNSENKTISVAETSWTGALIWTSSTTNVALNTKTSNFIGFEARSPYLFLKSSLVTDFHSTYRDNKTDQVFTKQDNILQKIQNNVNIYSFLHYRSSLTEAFVHEISGAKPITHFTISLTDDNHNLMEGDSFREFSCVLMFETHDPIATARLNEQVIEANQRSIFLSNHNC